jgi:hypothetical protein
MEHLTPNVQRLTPNGGKPRTIVLMCQARFRAAILDGSKPHSIRGRRGVRVGDLISLREWTGKPYRSKQRILREETCLSVLPICVGGDGILLGRGRLITLPHRLAKADGFADWPEMRAWFSQTHGLPFYGNLIRWLP